CVVVFGALLGLGAVGRGRARLALFRAFLLRLLFLLFGGRRFATRGLREHGGRERNRNAERQCTDPGISHVSLLLSMCEVEPLGRAVCTERPRARNSSMGAGTEAAAPGRLQDDAITGPDRERDLGWQQLGCGRARAPDQVATERARRPAGKAERRIGAAPPGQDRQVERA